MKTNGPGRQPLQVPQGLSDLGSFGQTTPRPPLRPSHARLARWSAAARANGRGPPSAEAIGSSGIGVLSGGDQARWSTWLVPGDLSRPGAEEMLAGPEHRRAIAWRGRWREAWDLISAHPSHEPGERRCGVRHAALAQSTVSRPTSRQSADPATGRRCALQLRAPRESEGRSTCSAYPCSTVRTAVRGGHQSGSRPIPAVLAYRSHRRATALWLAQRVAGPFRGRGFGRSSARQRRALRSSSRRRRT